MASPLPNQLSGSGGFLEVPSISATQMDSGENLTGLCPYTGLRTDLSLDYVDFLVTYALQTAQKLPYDHEDVQSHLDPFPSLSEPPGRPLSSPEGSELFKKKGSDGRDVDGEPRETLSELEEGEVLEGDSVGQGEGNGGVLPTGLVLQPSGKRKRKRRRKQTHGSVLSCDNPTKRPRLQEAGAVLPVNSGTPSTTIPTEPISEPVPKNRPR
ncbi:hypothetical protein Agabi119p4_10730 [Agaricus bisporus var. burnettii]|uniref:Uncharacterized protein n=1 Tax=Agaricus bisporus var. burnettii TaxID=192524 RepID=A0A8H7EWQ3_AGABI|nr:hypothetical protein Agabi119p4_10730 [Agaricus bisporus var. burnettii]